MTRRRSKRELYRAVEQLENDAAGLSLTDLFDDVVDDDDGRES